MFIAQKTKLTSAKSAPATFVSDSINIPLNRANVHVFYPACTVMRLTKGV